MFVIKVISYQWWQTDITPMMGILVFSDDDTDDDRGKWQAAYDFLFEFSVGGDDSTYW